MVAGRAKASSHTVHIISRRREKVAGIHHSRVTQSQVTDCCTTSPSYCKISSRKHNRGSSKATKVTSKKQLKNLCIKIDMDIIQEGAELPVGGHLAHFAKKLRGNLQ